MQRLTSWIDRRVGLEGHSVEQTALVEERIATLKPRMVWLYLLISLYLFGVELSLRETGISTWNFVPMAVLLTGRMAYWVRHRKTVFSDDLARDALRKVWLGAIAIAIGYLVLLGLASTQMDRATWQMLLLSGAVCAIAAAQTMAVFPASARIVLMILGLPSAGAAIYFSSNMIAAVVATNLMLCAGVSLYLLGLQDEGFRRHILLRVKGEADKHRAERAEQIAINERRQAKTAADTDFLTGLPNRRAFLAAIEARVPSAKADTVMILDLDGFKPVNDTLGHAAGDELLRQVGDRLRSATVPDMVVARLGGDEFALLLRQVCGDAALALADLIVETLGEPT